MLQNVQSLDMLSWFDVLDVVVFDTEVLGRKGCRLDRGGLVGHHLLQGFDIQSRFQNCTVQTV